MTNFGKRLWSIKSTHNPRVISKKKRTNQNIAWYQELQQEQLDRFLRTHPKLITGMDQIQTEMIVKNHSPIEASKLLEQLLATLFPKN